MSNFGFFIARRILWKESPKVLTKAGRNLSRFFSSSTSTEDFSVVGNPENQAEIALIKNEKFSLVRTKFEKFDSELLNEINLDFLQIPTNSKSFADFINFSETLQALVLLGVELYKIEKNHPEALEYLVTLDLNRDIKPKLDFLLSQGVQYSELSAMLTKNPEILDPKMEIAMMRENLDYLTDKKFSKEEILSIITRAPLYLTIPVLKLDGILGFYQKLPSHKSGRKISFTNSELREIILRNPNLLSANLYFIYEQIQRLEVSFQFSLNQIRQLVLHRPQILVKKSGDLTLLYKFYTRVMGYVNEDLVKVPQVFDARIQIVSSRHYYLEHLNRAVYKPTDPGYVFLADLVTGTDVTFCEKLNLGPVANFVKFQKTL